MSSSTSSYSEAWLTGPLSTQFYTRTYSPPSETPLRAVLVFVHGFAEHIGRYEHSHSFYASKGILVFAFDQRGFGLTAFDKTGKKTPSSSYGVTLSWNQQMADISWALEHAQAEYAKDKIPLFLMGHSMGGGRVFGFVTEDPPLAERSYVKAVIGSSPMLQQTFPANKLLRLTGETLSHILPNVLFPAAVPAEDLSRDPEAVAIANKDPFLEKRGTLLGLATMLQKGEQLVRERHAKWPKDLPLFILHGTGDRVTSHKASQTFLDKVPAEKKQIKLFDGGYHELHNEPDEVRKQYMQEVVSFIEAHLPSTESK